VSEDDTLIRLMAKVADGDVLEDSELAALDAASRVAPGSTLRVAFAQALLNADQADRALVLLTPMRRDFPNDVQVLLALSRALLALERWALAEEALKELLAHNGDDPEALVGLAALAMRRGELERARAYVKQALEVDPIHGEAQMLDAELLHQGLEGAGETRDDFVQALVAQLAVQSTPHLLQSKHLVVRLGQGGVARLDLESLYAEHEASGRPLARTVGALGKELAERALGLPQGREGLLTQVLPVLRDERFLERAVGSARREGPAGLWVFYVLEDRELVRYVPEAALASHGVTLDDIDAAAWKRLDTVPTPLRPIALEDGKLRLTEERTGLWAIAAADGHDAARVLTPRQQALIREAVGSGPLRLYFGLRELVLACRDDDAVMRGQLDGLQATREGIQGAYRLEGTRLVSISEWAAS
jgi:tetratricopeptide (TPR) repeat protein